MDGSHFNTEFVSGLAQGGVVTSLTRTETDLDKAQSSSPLQITYKRHYYSVF